MRKLVVGTLNKGKVREVRAMLQDLAFDVEYLADYPGVPDVEESGNTFAENAMIKARAYADYTGELVLADDSGLEVDALDGAPGVYSSRFAPDDTARIAKLLDMLDSVPDNERSARFRCVIALCEPNGEPVAVDGKVDGIIIRESKGTNGFGYDPVFYIPELGKTMAELPSDVKNQISHRGQALQKALKILEKID